MLWQPTPHPSSSRTTPPRSPTDHIHPLTASLLTAVTLLTGIYTYKHYIKRFPTALHIPYSRYRQRSLFGTVTSVGDGDNVRIFHTPGGRLMGWDWVRRVPKLPPGRGVLKDQTIHIRLAGIDAPEAAHFGKPAQPFSSEALSWLRAYTLNHRVRVRIYRPDQYERAVGTVYIRKGLVRKDVGYEMLKEGLATVYEAKWGAEFGGERMKRKYEAAEKEAREKKKGIWGLKKEEWVSPYEFKKEGRASGAPL